MELDRQSIEKKDFPVGRRGYDPDAVDAHLSLLADEIAELKRSSRRTGDTLATTASEQVRVIVEAAESSAGEITGAAEAEAREIRDEASNEVRAAREQASDQAREYVGKVSESTNAMLQRLDSMEQELSSLVESLREGGNRLNADLQLLEGDLAGVSDVVTPRARFELEPEPGALEEGAEPIAADADATGLDQVAGDAAMTETIPIPEGVVPAGESEQLGEDDMYIPPGTDTAEYDYAGSGGESHDYGSAGGEGSGSDAPGHEEADDAEGARLIALNMALNGTPREETERYLSENFRLADAHGLLDEVYASVEG